jgi:dipeptidyl aminopeptidase/acylaminoacyl peptidase
MTASEDYAMSYRSIRYILTALFALAIVAGPASQERRLLTVDDIFALKSVGDPRVSPDGQWVAYTVSQMDAGKDASDTDIWMAPFGGGDPLRLTTSEKSESQPRWSPDGTYLGFVSSRDGDKSQVWLLPRAGGEAFRLTDFPGGVSSFEWSPDSTRLAIVATDPDPDAEAKEDESKAPKPIVVTRRQFKRDGRGYLNDLRSHLYVFDIAAKSAEQVTDGPYDDSGPAWSPDGQSIAFVSNRTEDPDANQNNDVFLVAATPGATPRALTTSPGSDGGPAFTPDGRFVVYEAGGPPEDIWYATNNIAVVPVTGGAPRVLTPGLDRNVSGPTPTPDGRAVVFTLEDGGNTHLARVPLAGGAIERVVGGERNVGRFDVGKTGAIALLESGAAYPSEVFAVRNGQLERVTHVNDALLAGIHLGTVERFRSKSADGTLIDGFLTRPPGMETATGLPAILRIHGGPVSQFSTAFSFEWQILAAQGYAVIAANPRGSSGRGRDFSRAIWADWGNKDFSDVMGAVDHVVAMGVADPDRLGVGGWSYGGILTNYVITNTGRFKAAISGASEVNYTANYGHDHYQIQWEKELGLPWQNTALWLRLSPFFHLDNVTTPTLVMGGQSDWNVPIQNSDQLYQALRRRGIDTQLVVYPGQGHGISRPSYQKDRYERYIAWYDKHLKPAPAR